VKGGKVMTVKVNKSEYVRGLPVTLSAKEVVAKGKAAGISLTVAHVYAIRSKSKTSKGGGGGARGARGARKGVAPRAAASSPERVLVELVIAHGFQTVADAVEGLRARISQSLGGPISIGAGAPRLAVAAAAARPSVAKAKVRGGKLVRRSSGDIQKTADAIVSLLKKNPKGLRAEEIQKALGLHRRETPRPIEKLLATKKIRKTGEKRSTRYFA
jgi:hypothetical protein